MCDIADQIMFVLVADLEGIVKRRPLCCASSTVNPLRATSWVERRGFQPASLPQQQMEMRSVMVLRRGEQKETRQDFFFLSVRTPFVAGELPVATPCSTAAPVATTTLWSLWRILARIPATLTPARQRIKAPQDKERDQRLGCALATSRGRSSPAACTRFGRQLRARKCAWRGQGCISYAT